LMPHEVEVGAASSDFTEVLAGLEPGQKVVTSAQFLLDSESNLAEVMRSMIGQMSSGDLSKGQSMQDMPGMSMPARVVPKTPPTKR
jgi:membrane fusion protein, copper/silver efflux system